MIFILGIQTGLFVVLTLAEFRKSIAQCYENPAVISSTQRENQIFSFDLLEVGKQILDEVRERAEDSHHCTDKVCTFSNLQHLANSNSFFPLDDLDNPNIPIENETKIITDSFVQNNFCYVNLYDVSMLKGQACSDIYETIVQSSEKILGSNIDLMSKIPQRIIVEDQFITSKIDEQIRGEVVGKRTLELINFEHVNHINILNILPIWQNVHQILSIFGNTQLKDIQTSIEACTTKPLNLMQITKADATCIQNTLDKLRSKRSSFLSYLLGDGREISMIEETLKNVGDIINNNKNHFLENEHLLDINQKLLDDRIKSLEKGQKFSSITKRALLYGIKNQLMASKTSTYNLIRMLSNIDELERVALTLDAILTILPAVLLQSENQCSSFPPLHKPGCILTNESYATLEEGILSLNLKIATVKTQKAVKLSCLPKSLDKMEISELHNKLGIIEESNLVLEDYIIGRSELADKEVTDSTIKAIGKEELKHGNVFLTFNNDKIGITCVSNEILISDGSAFNCTRKAFWTDSKLITTKTGIIDIIKSFSAKPLSFNLITASNEEMKSNFSSSGSETTSLQQLIYDSVESVKIPHFVAVTAGGVLVTMLCLFVCIYNTYKLCSCCHRSQKVEIVQSEEPPIEPEQTRKAIRQQLRNLFKSINQQENGQPQLNSES